MRDFIEGKMGEKSGIRLKTAILQLILGKMMNWVTNGLGSALGLSQLKIKIIIIKININYEIDKKLVTNCWEKQPYKKVILFID